MSKSSFSKKNNKNQNLYNSGWIPAAFVNNNLEKKDFNNRSKTNIGYYESQTATKQKSYFFQNFLIIILFTYLLVSFLTPKVTVDQPVVKINQTKNYAKDTTYFFNLYGREADESYFKAHNRFLNRNNEICDNYQKYFRQFADSLAAEKCTYSNCTKLIAYLAKDQVTGSISGSDYLNELFESSLDNKMDIFVEKINENMKSYQDEMQQVSQNYAYNICSNLPSVSYLHFDKNQIFDTPDFKIALANLGLNTALNSVCVLFDAHTLIATGLFKNLRKYIVDLARVAFKGPIKKAAASVAASLVDGPLPIGDIISVVFIGWTVYDISCIRSDFQTQVADSIYNKFLEEINNVRYQSNDAIKNIYNNYHQIRKDMEYEFKKEYQKAVNHS